MSIGGIMIKNIDPESYTGCSVDDSASGCLLWMWDNYTETECKVTLSVPSCIELRNYLNRYIEAYVNTAAD